MDEETSSTLNESGRFSSKNPSNQSQARRINGSPSITRNDDRNESAPTDRYWVVYLVFYILGLGTLLPWNFFITANEYWMYKLRNNSAIPPHINTSTITASPTDDPDAVTYTRLQVLFQNTLSLCAMLPNVLFQFLNTMLQQRISEKMRIYGGLFMEVIFFIVTVVLVKIDCSSWQQTFFAVTMISIVLLNCASAVIQSSIFGIAAGLPQKYLQAVMAGQGMGGIFAAVAMIATIGFGHDPTSSAFAYFLIAIAVLFITGLSYKLLSKNNFYKYHHNQKRFANINETLTAAKNHHSINSQPGKSRSRNDSTLNPLQRVCAWSDSDDESRPLLMDADVTQPKFVPPLWSIFKKVWPHCFSVIFVFFVTLACFPSITSSIHSMSQKTTWNTLYFSPVSCFLLFNLTDWIGRSMAGYLHYPSEKQTSLLVFLVILRVAFMPLFALCNVQPRTRLPVIFNNDAYFIVFMAIFGLSNGHLSTLSMQYGPRCVESEHSETAGSLLGFAMSVGLAAGAGFSFVIKLII
ncbi:unnamed protein product [Clavelina lepadiformis]|uniref:Equilibrative nucleoside transporter 1 n=1 Tax=Clavelina lepadiformis TaxID=159417 RepID=A0ABP0FD07_CLALP